MAKKEIIMVAKVESSNISKLAFAPKTSTLFVEFTNGSSYMYKKVSLQVFSEFCTAPSVGKFLHSDIMGVYDSAKMEPST